MKRILFVPLAVAFGVTACGNSDRSSITDPVAPRQLTVDEQRVANANQVFGFELLRQVARSVPTGNVMISPLSVALALGMTLNGADGETFGEMRAALRFGELSREQINAAYEGLIEQLRARDPKVAFTIANSVWYAAGFTVEPAFLAAAGDHFGAYIKPLDFGSSKAPATINDWVSARTGGRIRVLIERIDPNDVMFLVNAMYFKAPWASPFRKQSTRDAPFERTDGSTVSARMMVQDGRFRHFRNDVLQVVELPYADSAYSMVLAAPRDAREASLDGLLAGFGATWREWLAQLEPGRIMLSVPRFEFRAGKDLNDELNALGIRHAFDPRTADFSRINPGRDDLHISRVAHRTFISVDEEGTEAAAATSVGMSVTSMPPVLEFNRPFLFAIRERSTGTVLFVGVVRDPTKN